MARKFTFPVQDASIYQQFSTRNAGLDEILDTGKTAFTSSAPSSTNNSRALIQFDISALSASLSDGTVALNATHYLNLKMANAVGLQYKQQLLFYMVSQSWQEGTGYLYQDVYNPQDGVTWIQRDLSGTLWPTGSGGTYITSSGAPSASFIFGYPPTDIRLDVTNIVNAWVSGTYDNNGFFIKLPDADESNINNEVLVQFYSNQTHTIYKPTIETVWYNQAFVTSSAIIPAPQYYLAYFRNLAPVYVSGSSARVDIGVRNQYPIKSFNTVFTYPSNYYLPTSSFYSIIDAQTNDTIVPFDSGSLVNCDVSGSYILFDTQNLYTNREYKLVLRVDVNGASNIIDNNMTFRVR